MSREEQSEQRFPVSFTQAQRKVVAEIAPDLAERLKLDERSQRAIPFTLDELKMIQAKADDSILAAKTRMVRRSLRHVVDLTAKALERFRGFAAIPAGKRVYQLKITLLDIAPAIWRRIQVKDGTLDKLHAHIQTAMGWTHSHLHDFKIAGKTYGDPFLLDESFDDFADGDSTTTRLSHILPKTGNRFQLEYQYDFGDSWRHEILFEGCLRAAEGERYPLCIEGARACPPEDVGGVPGYANFLEVIRNADHEEHEEMLRWAGGDFEPEAFDAATATKRMRRGLPNWRRMM